MIGIQGHDLVKIIFFFLTKRGSNAILKCFGVYLDSTIEKIERKLGGWKILYLSKHGLVTLI
jgi:hypothetical protein